MRHRLAVSLDEAKPSFDTGTDTSVSAYYRRALNFDSDHDQFGDVVDWTITESAPPPTTASALVLAACGPRDPPASCS